MLEKAKTKGADLVEWATANPIKATACAAGVVCVAAPGLVAAPLLGVTGFGANGIVAGRYIF
ncbi:hypothetical protein GGS23DRAFT_586619 [Durotheca rogersii]|uniref:uncharacterized protein n=1 Tax=Durotheca rogersii TaxID=419775 RepID=UPI0022207C1E|nr:uncharacterized protein GGS23DRAFT_586619 [Durotheca rogersii]KAI5858253.1 hypothetical protein GGS23DRAFT_586619 [Durotheca rogersii]